MTSPLVGQAGPAVDRKYLRRVTIAAAVGSTIEWYDYALYGAASAVVIGPLFFPNVSPGASQLLSFATFAVGFIARPFGGIAIGWVGDRFGRKSTLIVTVVLMGVVSALMGVLPTYSSIGIAAPIILVVLRLIQGLGTGAEFAGALTYLAESAEEGKRAYRASFISSSGIAGTFFSTGLIAILTAVTTHAVFLGWVWRIPFLLSAVLVIPAVIIRARIQESPEFLKLERNAVQHKAPRIPVVDMLHNDFRGFISVLLSSWTVSVVGYLITVFSVSYVIHTLKMPTTMSLLIALFATGVSMVVAPFWGILSDGIGAKKVMILGTLFAVAFAYPYFALLDTRNVVLVVIAAIVFYAVAWGMPAGAQGNFYPSLFKTRYRFTGVAAGREIGSAVVAGPSPLIAAALVNASGGQPWLVPVFIIVVAGLSLIGILLGQPRDIADQSLNSPQG